MATEVVLAESVGYDEIIYEQEWSRLTGYLGQLYACGGPNHFKVTASDAAHSVRVGAGEKYGRGVLDTNGTTITLTLDPTTSGQRWDTIYVRRNWQTAANGGESSVRVSKGGSSQAPVAGLRHEPGVVDDDILALVQTTAGIVAPTAVVDMRGYQPRSLTVIRSRSLTSGQDERLVADKDSRWPDAGTFDLAIPTWAAYLDFRYEVAGAQVSGSGTSTITGKQWARLSESVVSQAIEYRVSLAAGLRPPALPVPGRMAIPASMRGTTQTFAPRGNRTSGTNALQVDAASAVSLSCTFSEE